MTPLPSPPNRAAPSPPLPLAEPCSCSDGNTHQSRSSGSTNQLGQTWTSRAPPPLPPRRPSTLRSHKSDQGNNHVPDAVHAKSRRGSDSGINGDSFNRRPISRQISSGTSSDDDSVSPQTSMQSDQTEPGQNPMMPTAPSPETENGAGSQAAQYQAGKMFDSQTGFPAHETVDLIDLELMKRSTKTKHGKGEHVGSGRRVRKTIMRVVLLPFHVRFWRHQFPQNRSLTGLVVMYVSHLLLTASQLLYPEGPHSELSAFEVFFPLTQMCMIAGTLAYVSSTIPRIFSSPKSKKPPPPTSFSNGTNLSALARKSSIPNASATTPTATAASPPPSEQGQESMASNDNNKEFEHTVLAPTTDEDDDNKHTRNNLVHVSSLVSSASVPCIAGATTANPFETLCENETILSGEPTAVVPTLLGSPEGPATNMVRSPSACSQSSLPTGGRVSAIDTSIDGGTLETYATSDDRLTHHSASSSLVDDRRVDRRRVGSSGSRSRQNTPRSGRHSGRRAQVRVGKISSCDSSVGDGLSDDGDSFMSSDSDNDDSEEYVDDDDEDDDDDDDEDDDASMRNGNASSRGRNSTPRGDRRNNTRNRSPSGSSVEDTSTRPRLVRKGVGGQGGSHKTSMMSSIGETRNTRSQDQMRNHDDDDYDSNGTSNDDVGRVGMVMSKRSYSQTARDGGKYVSVNDRSRSDRPSINTNMRYSDLGRATAASNGINSKGEQENQSGDSNKLIMPSRAEARRHANFGDVPNAAAKVNGEKIAAELEQVMDLVSSVSWSKAGGAERVRLSLSDIRGAIETKVRKSSHRNHFYERIAWGSAVATGLLPMFYRACRYARPHACLFMHKFRTWPSVTVFLSSFPAFNAVVAPAAMHFACGDTCTASTAGCYTDLVAPNADAFNVIAGFLLCVAEDTFRRRYLYAKYFSKLTSARKAYKYGLPHFRLNKVDHIRVWLSLRTRRMDMERDGFFRAGDPIAVLASVMTLICIAAVGVKTFAVLATEKHLKKALKKGLVVVVDGNDPTAAMEGGFGADGAFGGGGSGGGWCNASASAAYMWQWEADHGGMDDWMLLLWTLVLSLFVSRFMALTSKTNKKYNNTSLLLTEQINLYIRMLKKKHLKDELMACNSVLGIAIKLISELEGGKGKGKGGDKHKALVNPQLYNLLRIMILSALGTMSSEYFGFKVKVWKL